jgi:hypothetical protein
MTSFEVNKMVGQKPIAKFGSAGGVSAALWENEINVGGGTKTILKASIGRRYKDSSGQWKSSTSFSRNEVPLAILALLKAYEKMVGEENGHEAENGAVEEEVVM